MYSDSENLQSSPLVDGSSRRVGATAEGGRSLLDQRTQLVIDPTSSGRTRGWRFTYWPGCSEASVVWVEPSDRVLNGLRKETSETVESGSRGRKIAGATFDGLGGVLDLVDDGEGDLNWRVANARARSRSRRFFVFNRLRYMWVLTFKNPPSTRPEVMSLVADFARRLRGDRDNVPLPYWYSPELHPGGHGWHINIFVPMWLEHTSVEELWGLGWVWVTDFEKSPIGPKGEPLGLCRTPREGWRRAAQYGCKYAQKDWVRGAIGPGNHRYEVAQGFSPVPVRRWLEDQNEAWNLVAELAPEGRWDLVEVWESNEDPEWDRPPVATFRW